MIELIQHNIDLVKHALRDTGLTKRSTHWPTVEKHFRETHATCAACGGTERLNVHHIIPFHINAALELDLNNLITLCMGKLECHLKIGHLNDFHHVNQNVRDDCEKILANQSKRDEIIKVSMDLFYPKIKIG
jgi:hypothetical protein